MKSDRSHVKGPLIHKKTIYISWSVSIYFSMSVIPIIYSVNMTPIGIPYYNIQYRVPFNINLLEYPTIIYNTEYHSILTYWNTILYIQYRVTFNINLLEYPTIQDRVAFNVSMYWCFLYLVSLLNWTISFIAIYIIIYIYIYTVYIYTTILPLSCTDGRYFHHISGTALFSCTNYDFFGSIVIFLLHFGYIKSKSRKWL